MGNNFYSITINLQSIWEINLILGKLVLQTEYFKCTFSHFFTFSITAIYEEISVDLGPPNVLRPRFSRVGPIIVLGKALNFLGNLSKICIKINKI